MQTSSDTPLPAPSGDGWVQRFVGKNTPQHWAVKRLTRTWLTYGFVDVVLLLSAMMGLVPLWASVTQVAYHLVGMVCFYAVLRSGRTVSSRDPALTFEQLLFGVSAIVLSYALTPLARGAALQLLCLALVFDMQRLSSKQLSTAAWGAFLLLVVALLVSWLLRSDDFNTRREVLNLIMAGVQLPALSMIARDVRAMRQKQLKQRVDLQNTLGKLEQLSQRDSLTGLYNRRHMGILLEHELKRFTRQKRPFSLALLDIDYFKQINDRFGHAVGDATLQTFARLAREHLPTADAMARWGGEEFLLLIPEQNASDALATVESLRRCIEAYDWTTIAPELTVRFSAGLTDHTRRSDTVYQSVERADHALYQAKAQGRNQVVCVPRTPV